MRKLICPKTLSDSLILRLSVKSVDDIAKELGVTPPTIRNWMDQSNYPQFRYIAIIEKHYPDSIIRGNRDQ